MAHSLACFLLYCVFHTDIEHVVLSSCRFRLFRKWRTGESTGLCYPSVPHLCFLALLALSLPSRNFLPLSFICFKSKHLATAMLLATVESKREKKETESNIWNPLLPCQPSHRANWGHFHPSLPGLCLQYFFSSYIEQSKHCAYRQACNLKMYLSINLAGVCGVWGVVIFSQVLVDYRLKK